MRAFEHNCALSNKHNCAGVGAYAARMRKSATLALADNVRRLMEDAGLSQRELASKAGISQRAVGYLLNYKDEQDRHPTTQTVEAVAGAFGVDSWLLMMPDLPVELVKSKRFEKMIENYRDAPDAGRAQVERIAESEVKYAVAEAALAGGQKTGTKG